jgi:hypothetical protein
MGENRIHQLLNTTTPARAPGSPPPSPPPGSPPPSSPPSSPPSTPPGGSGEVKNDADQIDKLAQRLQASVGPKLTKARQTIGALHLAESAYTAVTYALAIAYTEASAFMIKDLDTKDDQLGEMGHGLKLNAQAWRTADKNSTIHKA